MIWCNPIERHFPFTLCPLFIFLLTIILTKSTKKHSIHILSFCLFRNWFVVWVVHRGMKCVSNIPYQKYGNVWCTYRTYLWYWRWFFSGIYDPFQRWYPIFRRSSFCIIFHLWNINSVCMRSLYLQRKATVALAYLLWDWLDSIKNILKHGLFYHFPAFTNVKKTQYSHVTFNVKSTWWKFFEKRTYYFQCSKKKFLNTIFQRIFNNK